MGFKGRQIINLPEAPICLRPALRGIFEAAVLFLQIQLNSSNSIVYDSPTPPQCHHMSFCGLRGPPSWAWQECNRLLMLGRP